MKPPRAMIDLDASLSPTRKARIEIIPLIDVIFFLLATFVLFTLSLEKVKVIVADMPVPGESKESMTVYIQVSDDGTYFWKQGAEASPELISAAELRPRLENYVHNERVPRVFVRSDAKARVRNAVLVLDEVRRAGIKQVSVETFATKSGS
jgi:biopolymer transport protein ExbD